jgi:hypothetical protein
VFEGLQIVRSPALLAGYDMVVTPGSYMDVDLLAALDEKYTGQVLLFGRLDVDAFARSGRGGLSGELVRRKIILQRESFPRLSSEALGSLDLSGTWRTRWLDHKAEGDETRPPKTDGPDWADVSVPGFWPEVGLLGSGKFHMDDTWQIRKVVIPAAWKGRALSLKMGAIDDFDWTYFNGVLIGRTDASHQNWWLAPRSYAIPSEAVRWGQENVIAVRIHNNYNNGGIWKGPVRIVGSVGAAFVWADAKDEPSAPVTLGTVAARLSPEDLSASAAVLGHLSGLPQLPAPAALVRSGRWSWWIHDGQWEANSGLHRKVLEKPLQSLRFYPSPPAASGQAERGRPGVDPGPPR